MKTQTIIEELKKTRKNANLDTTNTSFLLIKIMASLTRSGVIKTKEAYSLNEQILSRLIRYYYKEAENKGFLLWRGLSEENILGMNIDKSGLGEKDKREVVLLRKALSLSGQRDTAKEEEVF